MDAEKRADDFLGLKMQKNPIYNTQAKPTTNISMTTGDNSTAGHHLSHSDVKPTLDLHLRHYRCLAVSHRKTEFSTPSHLLIYKIYSFYLISLIYI